MAIGDFANVRIKVNASDLARRFGAAGQGADLGTLIQEMNEVLSA